MREMKDSGVISIGLIPVNWSVRKFKTLAKLCNGREVNVDEGCVPVYGSGGIFKWTNIPLHSGESLLMGRKGTIDNPMLVKGEFWTVDTMFYTSEFYDIKGKFLYYCCKGTINYGYYKSGSVLPSMTQMEINNVFLPYTTSLEQDKIVNVLDKKCAQIDALIANQQTQIEKLKAYKQSLITEVVTKGLGPDVPMKDSGIEWIGCYPTNWRLSQIGKVVKMGAGGTPNRNIPEYWENGSIPWMSSGEINNEYVYDTLEKITKLGMVNSNAKLLPINTVMLALIGQGKTKGLAAILKTECTCNQNLAYLIANPYFLHYEYLFYCFKAMYSYIRGIVGESQAGIYQSFLKMQFIPIPSSSEQIMISDYLNEKCTAIKHLITKKQAKIEKLEQYKKSLIYEYVTGKREVM